MMTSKKEYTILNEIDLNNGLSIVVWEDGVIQLPSTNLTLEEACELIGKLQKAIETVREFK